MNSGFDIVTGSFSYTGQYITRKLLASGRNVRTLTGHPRRTHPLSSQIAALPYDFEHPDRLTESLRGADILYNTYWVRFPRGRLDYDVAVQNSRVLVQAAVRAGIRRIVHVSIINASENSPYAYFRGKARVERAIENSGLSFAILRPTVVFGPEDILINNIAWMIRRFPVFLMPGSGNYLLQPIHVGDLADMAVNAGAGSDSKTMDAVGSEIFTYRELVGKISRAMNRNVRLMEVPAAIAYGVGAVMGWFVHDVVLTYEEVLALKDSVLYSAAPPAAATLLSEWLAAHKDQIGCEYRSEVHRHFSFKEAHF